MSRARELTLAALLATVAASCAPAAVLTPVRASSVPILGARGSSLHLNRDAAAVLQQLAPLFDKRGDHLIAEYPAKDGSGDKLYAFKGRREAVVLGAVETPYEGLTSGETRSYQFGSVFYTVLHAASASATDSKLSDGGPLLPSLQGKEEADAIRGVLLELEQLNREDH